MRAGAFADAADKIQYLASKDALVVSGGQRAVRAAARVNGALVPKRDLKTAAGRVLHRRGGYALVPATAMFAARVDELLDQACWSEGAEVVRARARAAIAARPLRDAGPDGLPELPGSPEPAWLHQRQAFAFLREQEGGGAWIAMGGGKSRVAVALALHHHARRVLITCPRTMIDEGVVDVWTAQFQRWAPDADYLVGGRVLRQRGQGAKVKPSVRERLAALAEAERLATARDQPLACTVPWDSFWRDEMFDWLLEREWDLWVQDEDHRVKAPGGKAGKAAARLRGRAKRRVGLSGTPIPHSKLDAYGVYRALDPGVFGTNFFLFKRRYAVTVPLPNAPGADKVVGWQNEDEFDDAFHSVAFVWDQDRAVLGIPDPIVVERPVTLGTRTWRVYQQMDSELIADIDDGLIVADNALVRLLRLQQVCCGVVTTEDGRKVQLGTEKADSFRDWIEDLPPTEPVVAFGKFHGDLDSARIACERSSRTYAELSGRKTDGYQLDDWEQERADVLGVQIQAGGSGLDFTRSHYGAWLSTGFSFGDLTQSQARQDRPGQKWPPTRVRFIAEGPAGQKTVDREVWDALDARRDLIDAVLSARRRRGRRAK